MYQPKTIIFDLDGTLFKTETIFSDALNTVCIKKGIPTLGKENIVKLIGQPMTKVCKELFGEQVSTTEITSIRNDIRNIERKVISNRGILYDGIVDILQKLQSEDYTLCICTNGSKEYVDLILNNFKLYKYFSYIKYRDENLTKCQLIKQILDESACCSAIIVGDTQYDFTAANEVGCLSIGVSYGYGGNDYNKADFQAHNVQDIYGIIKKINETLFVTTECIIRKKQRNKPLLVGINGVDTSGKTVFTKELRICLSKSGFKVQVVHLDDFHNPLSIRNSESDIINSYFNHAFHFSKLEDEVINPIISTGKLNTKLTLLDVKTDEYSVKKKFFVDEWTIVLIEGVLLYREPIDQYFDFRIYLDISFDEVMKRAAKRDKEIYGSGVEQRYQEKYIPVQERYIKRYNPVGRSDIVIRNDDYLNPKIIKKPELNISTDQTISLEPINKTHLKKIIDMYNNEQAREMLGITAMPDMNYFLNKDNKCYVITGNGCESIGLVELFDISWKNRRAELSIIIDSSLRGRGYGYMALIQVLNIGFGQLGLNRIWLRVLVNNHAAIHLYKKVGFIEEGICRDESLRNGVFISQLQMSILQREWV